MALMKDSIKILGAREHNLKDLDLEIPKIFYITYIVRIIRKDKL